MIEEPQDELISVHTPSEIESGIEEMAPSSSNEKDENFPKVPKLDRTNYPIWRRKMMEHLTCKELDEVCLVEPPANPSQEIKRKMNRAAVMIGSYMSDNLYNTMITESIQVNPHLIWNKIENELAGFTALSLCRVWKTWLNIYLDNDLGEYIDKIESCLREFDTVGFEMPPEIIISSLITGVTEKRPDLMDSLLMDDKNLAAPDVLLLKLKDIALNDKSNSSSKQ